MDSTTYEWVLDELGALEKMNVWHDAMPSTTVVFTTRQLPAPKDADVQFMSGDVADAVPELLRLAGEGII